MKRNGVVLCLILIFFVRPLQSDVRDYKAFSDGFVEFSRAFADELPFGALIGLNWADAYIGNFPHFGVGVTLGATTVPFDTLDKAMDPLGIDLSGQFPVLGSMGFPFPVAVFDARVGGVLTPFDVGFKAGWLPGKLKIFLPSKMTLEYLMIGGDVRFALSQDEGWAPDISVGVGYTYYRGSITMEGITESSEEIANVKDSSGTHTLSFQDPDVVLNWETNVIDLKIQISKDIFILTPFVGVGLSYATSKSGGGLKSDVLFDGHPITPSEIEGVEQYYASIDKTVPDLSTKGILIEVDSKGFAYRAFGGLSLKISVLRINLSGMYNFTSGALGGSLNTTIQY